MINLNQRLLKGLVVTWLLIYFVEKTVFWQKGLIKITKKTQLY